MRSQQTHSDQAAELNHIINRALTDPSETNLQAVGALVTRQNVYRLAERVRRRATVLTRHNRKDYQNLQHRRDALIMVLYAKTSPAGWANAWCDGSSITHDDGCRAGIGAIVFSPDAHRLAQTSVFVGNKTAFEAEVQAIIRTLQICASLNITKVRIHTDNKGLVQLWREHRQDSRLTTIRHHAREFEKLQIRAIPRLHNQATNALAKRAALSDR
ncbi:ribonuclease H family protein [Kaarinaea lacus]